MKYYVKQAESFGFMTLAWHLMRGDEPIITHRDQRYLEDLAKALNGGNNAGTSKKKTN